jgi:hypothetical protein
MAADPPMLERPRSARSLPGASAGAAMTPDIRRPADVTPDWLTAVLRAGGVDAPVVAFTAANVGTGQLGESVRFALDYADPVAGAPRSIVGKFPAPGIESRTAGVTLGNYRREVKFYQELQASALVSTPRCYFAEIDPATHDFVLMMEDLAPAAQGDQLLGVTLDQARLVIGEAAKLHASHWQDDDLDELDWVNGARVAPNPVAPEIIAALWTGFLNRYGARASAQARAVGDGLCARLDLYEELRQGPRCLTHNDFRPDNMMFATPSGGRAVTVLDWQSIGYGPGGADVGYFIAGAITPAQRRAHGPALVDLYIAELAARGVVGYGPETVARHVVAGALQLFLTAFFAAMLVTQTPRGDDMFFKMIDGATALIADERAISRLL